VVIEYSPAVTDSGKIFIKRCCFVVSQTARPCLGYQMNVPQMIALQTDTISQIHAHLPQLGSDSRQEQQIEDAECYISHGSIFQLPPSPRTTRTCFPSAPAPPTPVSKCCAVILVASYMITLNESALQEAYLLRVVTFESLTGPRFYISWKHRHLNTRH
jgi:hypothetical protein